MKKLLLLLLIPYLIFAQDVLRLGAYNGTTSYWFQTGQTKDGARLYFNKDKQKYYYITNLLGEKDTIPLGVDTAGNYTWAGKHTFKNIVTFDSTVYADSGQFWGSKSFVPGWAGSGWKLDYGITDSGRTSLTLDDLTIRGRLSVYELLVRQIRAVNGNLFVTSSAKVKEISGDDILFDDPTENNLCPFSEGDLLLAQRYDPSGDLIRQVKATVISVSGASVEVSYDTGEFRKGDEVVRVGNTTDATKRGSIYLSADDVGSPYMMVIDGVSSWAEWGSFDKVKVIVGKIDGVVHPYWGELSGYGLLADNVYLDNAYFRGEAVFTNPGDIADSLKNYLSISANWDSLTNRPTYFNTPSGSGLFLSATHMGYYTGGAWKTYWDNSGNMVLGNIGAGGQGFSWNQSAGTMSISGSLKIFNKQEISDSLKFSTVFRQASAPTIRPDGTSLKDNDLWIDSDDNNRRYIRSGGSWVSISAGWINPTWTSGTSFPGSPAEGDWHFWTGAEGTYRKNTWYQYVSSTWTARGLYGTYIDDTGLYTGTVVANNILAGTGLINNLSVLSTLTVGSAGTDGYIQSYGWNGTVNGFQIKGGSTPTINLIGGSFTSSTITGGTLSIGSGNNIFKATSDGIQLGHATFGSAPFRVTMAGALTASNATISGGTIGGFSIGGNYFTSNNMGLYSGATSMLLLGHATDYASAKIGFKNDGSGKVASGNFYWDASGNITASTITLTNSTGTGINLISGESKSSATMTYARGVAGTESGYWLGDFGGTPLFFIGSSATKHLKYDDSGNLSMVGGTITGGTIQTATGGKRITIRSAENRMDYWNASGDNIGGLIYNAADANGLQLFSIGQLSLLSGYDDLSLSGNNINITGAPLKLDVGGLYMDNLGYGTGKIYFGSSADVNLYRSAANTLKTDDDFIGENIYSPGSINIGTPASKYFTVDSDGAITKVNNTAASGNQYKVLASNNTSFTPVTLSSSHLPSEVVYTNTAQTISGAKTLSGVQSFSNEVRTTNVLTVYGTGSYSVAGYNVVTATPPSSGHTITLTGMATGQNIFVTNTSGSLSITICGVSLPAGKSMYARYNGSSWNTVIGN